MSIENFDGNQERGDFNDLKEVLSGYPEELVSDVQLLTEPNLSREEFMELLEKVNRREQPEPEGMYRALSFYPKPKRNLTVKCFENGRLSVSGSDLEGIE